MTTSWAAGSCSVKTQHVCANISHRQNFWCHSAARSGKRSHRYARRALKCKKIQVVHSKRLGVHIRFVTWRGDLIFLTGHNMWFQSVRLSLKHQTSASSKRCADRRALWRFCNEHETAFRWSKDQVFFDLNATSSPASHAENQWERRRITFTEEKGKTEDTVLWFRGKWMSLTVYLTLDRRICARFHFSTTERTVCTRIMVFSGFLLMCRVVLCRVSETVRLHWKEKRLYWSFKLPTGRRCMRSIKLSAHRFWIGFSCGLTHRADLVGLSLQWPHSGTGPDVDLQRVFYVFTSLELKQLFVAVINGKVPLIRCKLLLSAVKSIKQLIWILWQNMFTFLFHFDLLAPSFIGQLKPSDHSTLIKSLKPKGGLAFLAGCC